jgi:hypothetical protein
MVEYSQLLESLENKRQQIVSRSRNCLLIGAGLVIINLLASQFLPEIFQVIIILSIITLLIFIAMAFDAANKYRNAFKESLMPILIQKVGSDMHYDYKKGIGEHQTMDAKLFKNPDRYHCEDLIYGVFDDVSFFTSDVIMKERRVTRDSKGHTRTTYVPYFNGRWFVYDFNKTFNGIIQVREDGIFEGPRWGLKMSKIELEDVEFNRKFKTYSTHQHDAFYVLTPPLMEQIKLLERRYPGQIYFSFIGTKLHIAINGAKNSFEPPMFSPLTDHFIEEQVKDIMIIQEIVQELKLNRKIFK